MMPDKNNLMDNTSFVASSDSDCILCTLEGCPSDQLDVICKHEIILQLDEVNFMGQGRQAKTLSEAQIKASLSYLQTTRYPERDQAMFLLSLRAGMRAKEIAALTWAMVTDPEGQVIDRVALPNTASKGKSGRDIPIHRQLKDALIALQEKGHAEPDDFVIKSERGEQMKANSIVCWFKRLFNTLGFDGCSSHSGRRTFITHAARKASLVGASIRDVQQLAGHSSLVTTQRYVDGDSEAKRKLVNLL